MKSLDCDDHSFVFFLNVHFLHCLLQCFCVQVVLERILVRRGDIDDEVDGLGREPLGLISGQLGVGVGIFGLVLAG